MVRIRGWRRSWVKFTQDYSQLGIESSTHGPSEILLLSMQYRIAHSPRMEAPYAYTFIHIYSECACVCTYIDFRNCVDMATKACS